MDPQTRRAYAAMKMVSLHRRTKLKAIEYKGGKCERCGYSRSPAALTFHHRDPAQKDFSISSKNWRWERVRDELDKCELLCSNCHNEEHERLDRERLEAEHARIRKLVPERPIHPTRKLTCSTCGASFRRPRSAVRSTKVYCSTNCVSESQEKTDWPSEEKLKKLVWDHPVTHVAKMFGVSDKAVKKRCRKLGVITPGQGYWNKRKKIRGRPVAGQRSLKPHTGVRFAPPEPAHGPSRPTVFDNLTGTLDDCSSSP